MNPKLFELVIKIGHTRILSLFIEHGMDPTYKNNYPIRSASFFGHYDMVDYLLSLDTDSLDLRSQRNQTTRNDTHTHGLVDPSDLNNFAFRSAARRGHIPILTLLLQKASHRGVDPAANENEPIRDACTNGSLDVIKFLLSLPSEYKIDISARNNECIRMAAWYGNLNVVKFLTELPVEYNITAEAKNIAFSSAIKREFMHVVDYLASLPDVDQGLLKSVAATPQKNGFRYL
jgi:ankyrin repeat protein